MSISSLIREEVKELSLEGRDINIRKIARKYKCSPSLVVKNVYKVEKEENYKHITKFGVKGKVNLVIIDFDEEKEKELKQWFAPECLPTLTQNNHLESSPPLKQNSHFECLPLLTQNSPPECLPHLTQNTPSECLPLLTQSSAPKSLPLLKQGSPSFSLSPTSAPECLPHLTPNSHLKSSPHLTQNSPFKFLPSLTQKPNLEYLPAPESLPPVTQNSPFECLPHLKQNTNFKSSSHLMANPNFESSPSLTQSSSSKLTQSSTPKCLPALKQGSPSFSPSPASASSFESSPHLTPNPNLECLPPLTQNPNLQAPLFNVHQNFKEKEKVSYNLLKEKETEKFINKFLSISQIDSLTSLNKYEKEILKTYIKYGGKLRESEIKFGKEILFYATPKQFEAILLKVIREKKGETPRISYLCEVTKRFNLKSRKKKATPKLFEKAKAFNKFKTYENSIDKELTSTFSYLGLTGEDALRAFFGDSFKKENFVGVLNG